jgi:hypothetical protein
VGVGPILTPLYCGNGKNQKQICNMLNKEFFIRKIKGKKQNFIKIGLITNGPHTKIIQSPKEKKQTMIY